MPSCYRRRIFAGSRACSDDSRRPWRDPVFPTRHPPARKESAMCGIAGILSLSAPLGEADDARLKSAAAALAHRGPDDDGYYRVGEVGLAFRRLSILDLAGGHQPMANEDGAVQVIFNGEIYNFQELTQRLKAAGHQFRTRSDTETLVHLYEERGVDFVHELRGMFTIALWDARQHRLILVRDRLGIKPLY